MIYPICSAHLLVVLSVSFVVDTLEWPEWPYYPDPQNCSARALPTVLDKDASTKLDVVHVVYSSNSNKKNLALLLQSMISLSRNLQHPDRCVIHLLVAKVDMTNLEGLVACFRHELATHSAIPKVQLHEMRTIQLNISDPRRLDIAQNTYFRYYVHLLLDEKVPRAIVLDADTTITADVTPMYQMHMEHPIAAVRVHWPLGYIQNMFQLGSDIRQPHALAFNAGVLLYDLARWRSEDFTRALEAWTPLTSRFLYDQTPLNIVFQDKADTLDWRWNVLHLGWAKVARRCFNRGRILHWNGPQKHLGRSGRYRHLVDSYVPRRQCEVLQ